MAQFNWTYLSDSGRRHVVGLYHGNRTGHLIVHCNSRIVIIDFHVLQSKMYSFFIDDELCEIELERKDNRFYYGFKINQEVDTPKNRQRRATEKKHLRKGLILLGILALFVSMIFFGLRYHNGQFASSPSQARSALLDGPTGKAVARISGITTSPSGVEYTFVADGRIYRTKQAVDASTEGYILPLREGDEFPVRYALRRPQIHTLDLGQPSDRQIERYRERALNRHRDLHPDLSDKRIACVLDALYQVSGITAYADIYYQHRQPSQNSRHNRRTYETLITDPQVTERLSACSNFQ